MLGSGAHSNNGTPPGAFCFLLIVAVICGGGGVRYGLFNLAVQLTALWVLGLHRQAFFQFWGEASLALKALVLASVILPIIHVIPLPPQVWTALPGREAVGGSLSLLNLSGNWTSLSVDPARTWVALSGLIVPLVLLSLGWSIAYEKLILIGWVVVLLGIVNVLIGVPQVLSNGATGLLYPETPMPGVLFGTFANRNSTGLFLLSALSCAALLPSPIKHDYAWVMRALVCALLLTGILLTRSRTALVLALIPVLLGVLRAIGTYQAQRRNYSKPRSFTWAAISVFGAGLLSVGIGSVIGSETSGRINDTFSRFEASSDARIYIWEDAAFSAKRYWPVGSGMGTFDEVFQLEESLENISQRRAGRAHNDYLEVAIEAGLPGLIIIVGWIVLCGYMTARPRSVDRRWSSLAGAGILICIVFQSLVDYPLRNQAMLATASFAILLLCRVPMAQQRGVRFERQA